MGKIADGVLHDWSDGEVVTSAGYEQDREMLRTAINDNFDRLVKSFTVQASDGSTKATKNFDTAFNFLKLKEGNNVQLALDTASGVLTITAVPADASVSSAMLADGSVITVKLADKAVTQAKIADKAVGSGQIADKAVGSGQLGDGSVGTLQIADNSVTGPKIPSATITRAHLAADAAMTDGINSIRITALENDVASGANPSALTFGFGPQIANIVRDARLRNVKFSGRTLVNLLGRDGNCEATTPFTTVGTVNASTTQFKSGTKSIFVSTVGGTSYAYKNYSYPLGSTKQYIVAGWIYLASFTSGAPGIYLKDFGDGTIRYSALADTSKVGSWQFVYVKIPTGNTFGTSGFTLALGQSIATTWQAYFDEVRLYELSATDYAAIGTTYTTGDQIDRFLPYVDDMKHVNGVWVRTPGKNLLPPFTDWKLIHANAAITAPYELTLKASAASQYSDIYVPSVPLQTYTLSVDIPNGGIVYLQDYDSNFVNISTQSRTTNGTITITTAANSAYLRVRVDNNTATSGTFVFRNAMLNVGAASLPFEPQQPSYVFLPDVQAKSNVDGSVADQVYQDGESKFYRLSRFREMVLDGTNNAWAFSADLTGYKQVSIASPNSFVYNATASTSRVVKYDGKVLDRKTNSGVSDGADAFQENGSNFYLTVADTDSGLGETWAGGSGSTASGKAFTESQIIKAYFNGWKWTAGNPAWTSMGTAATSDDPAYVAANLAPGYTPYRLMYQLAQPVPEYITQEGELFLPDGDIQVDMGTGLVLREAAKPVKHNTNTGDYAINRTGSSFYPNGGELSKRDFKILAVYKNGAKDSAWVTVATNAYGNEAVINNRNYDPTAAYSVTYEALDKYQIGIPPLQITAEYAPNTKETVDGLTRKVVELATETAVLRNQKTGKQKPGWIAPALLNGWSSASTRPAAYSLDDAGIVMIKGTILTGTITSGTVLFYLPPGYRPTEIKAFPARAWNGSTHIFACIGVQPSGAVTLELGTSETTLDGISFRAEQ